MRICIVDDEYWGIQNIEVLLAEKPGFFVSKFDDPEQALIHLKTESADLLFLDIQMPGINGFELLERLGSFAGQIIFITAFDQFAIQAFEYAAMDYLLKPFSNERFEQALDRAVALHQTQGRSSDYDRLRQYLEAHPSLAGLFQNALLEPKQDQWPLNWTIRDRGVLRIVAIEDIHYLVADNYYTCLFDGKKKILIRRSIAQAELSLDPSRFLRIHRSSIVNLQHVQKVNNHPNGTYSVTMKNGIRLPLSRSKRDLLRQLLYSS